MKELFATEMAQSRDMYQVQSGVLRVLSDQERPLNYVIGGLNLINFQPDNRLAVSTELIRRFLPVFSDSDVFTRSLVDRLQSYGNLSSLEVLEYRRTVINLGKIEAVIFLPGWSLREDVYDAYNTAQSKGKTVYMLEDPRHQWLQF